MTSSKKIFWNAAECRGFHPCDWSCLKNETQNAAPNDACRSCDIHLPKAKPNPSDGAVVIEADGRSLTCVPGTLLLDVLRKAGIDIPTMCHHPLLPPQGACRLCVVEISHGSEPQMVAACEYRVTAPMSVRTDTDRILRNRRVILELLLSEAPDAPLPGCIACGRCIAVCEHIIGCRAMEMCGRSSDTRPAFPFDAASDDACTQCGACAAVCPTGALIIQGDPKGAPSCDLCVQICPDAAITKSLRDGTISVSDTRCKECGLCAHYCPDKALHPSFYYDR